MSSTVSSTDGTSSTPTLFGSSAPASSSSSSSSGFGSSGLSAVSYYGAVAVVVFVLVLVTIISRMLYTRRMKRARAERLAMQEAREREERAGMERRGEAGGLPTYRESSHAARSGGGVTRPEAAHTNDDTVAPPPYRPPPPKYEDEDEVSAAAAAEEGGGSRGGARNELGHGGQARDASSVIDMPSDAVEMTEMGGRADDGDVAATEAEDDAAAYERRTRGSDQAAMAEHGVAPRAPEPDPASEMASSPVVGPESDHPYGPHSDPAPTTATTSEEQGRTRGWSRWFARSS